jgi:formate hydrogenlyase subunit 3/multisubunit Na+/H+ antiporter MnhD subunit
MAARAGWGWFAAWAGAGVPLAFSLARALSIGLFVLPFALLALWAIFRRSPPRTTAFGLASGAGLVCLVIWALNTGSSPCPERGTMTVPPGGVEEECGGLYALPFLVAGIVLTLVGLALFAAARRRGGTAEEDDPLGTPPGAP